MQTQNLLLDPSVPFMEVGNWRLDAPTLFAGGRLCLDFINTELQRRDVHVELLTSGETLKQWLRLAETMTGKSLCSTDLVWNANDAEQLLARARELRAALREMVSSVIEERPTPTTAINSVNVLLRANPSYPQIGMVNGQWEESIAVRESADGWLVAIAEDAVDLLCHSDLSLLRKCECATCTRVFFDTTKNHKRRWCVEKCSSQTKAAAYYQRRKARVKAGTDSTGTEVT